MLSFDYPDLPISRHRELILDTLKNNQVLVIVGETGSGKTTQLPKIATELVSDDERRYVGCTQPRRLAAVSVARRVAEEIGSTVGDLVGYQVRFDDATGPETRLKFMTDGILLAEIQSDPDLRHYHTIILDEAHERSLNIDFLLGYLKLLIQRRKDLKLIISSATLDSGSFSEFFDNAPIISVEGRTFPVDLHYMPPISDDEELPEQVLRAVDWLTSYDTQGDVLVFLPGEREIRDVAAKLEGHQWARTEVLPLFARLSLAEQQKIFHPNQRTRRIVLATNVAETSLTIPGIIYVIDSGLARISRYSAARQIQRLQIEEISQASARQRAGRCGRITEGVCIRLYSEENFDKRAAFTDPEIKRSSLSGVLLKMKDLGLPDIGEFPLPDPPSSKLISEGYRTLREIGALDKQKQLTKIGRNLARLPIDPRLGRMLLEASHEQALPELLVIVAGLNVMDPRERPATASAQADTAHAVWKNDESDFLSMLRLWIDAQQFKENRHWRRNQLRRWCSSHYLNMTRLVEWSNLHEDLTRLVREVLRFKVPHLEKDESKQASYAMIHRSILAGIPRQIGVWDPDTRNYKSVGGKRFLVFPGSGLFRKKKQVEWVMGVELVETSQLWMRRCARLDPVWIEQVAPQLCEYHYSQAHWDRDQGAVYAIERVSCGGLTIQDKRRVHYGRIHPENAREIMIRDGFMKNEVRERPEFLKELSKLHDEVLLWETKIRKPDQLWCEDGVFEFLDKLIPADICTAKAFQRWWRANPKLHKQTHLTLDDVSYTAIMPEAQLYPDELVHQNVHYPLFYQYDPGAEDDGVSIGIHIDQLADFPEWLPDWGVPGQLKERAECCLRSLPKSLRIALQPISQKAQAFSDLRRGMVPEGPFLESLAEFVEAETGTHCGPTDFSSTELPQELITKLWVFDDKDKELGFGTSLSALQKQLKVHVKKRFAHSVAQQFKSEPMTSWECGDLADTKEINGQTTFVALSDHETYVSTQLFHTEREAEESHRIACIRLASLALTPQLNHLKKKFPLGLEGKLALSIIGEDPSTTLQDLILVTLEVAMGSSMPRTKAQFDEAVLRARQTLFDESVKIAKFWETWAHANHTVRDFVSSSGQTRFGNRIADDFITQLKWLERPHFILLAGGKRLPDLLRFAKGMEERIHRLNLQPLEKELDRIKQFQQLYEPWRDNYPQHSQNILWNDFGYLLEEFRLSIFVPQLAIKGRASTKKLHQLWEELHKTS